MVQLKVSNEIGMALWSLRSHIPAAEPAAKAAPKAVVSVISCLTSLKEALVVSGKLWIVLDSWQTGWLTNWNAEQIGLHLKEQLVLGHATGDLKFLKAYSAVFVHWLDDLQVLERDSFQGSSNDVSFGGVLGDANHQSES